MELDISWDQYLEIEKLTLGVFYPLKTFMNKNDFDSSVERMRLSSGDIFPIPIIFDMNENKAKKFERSSTVKLFYKSKHVADIAPQSIYSIDKEDACLKIFGTLDKKHPGVAYFLNLEEFFVTGALKLLDRPSLSCSKYELTPSQIKKEIALRGWKRTVGFQTRNIPHRAHEYLQKIALEQADGILIQPIVGFKKIGDFTPEAVIATYENLIENYFPPERVILAVLSTVMRYAGPREAIFHALIRRNYGCTDFIIGRDHAGVGGYYEKYAGHRLASHFGNEIGINIINLSGPHYCAVCDGIVTEKTCPHLKSSPTQCSEVSGTDIRGALISNKVLNSNLIRTSVIDTVKKIKEPFVK